MYYPPGAYYRTANGEPMVPTQNGIPSIMSTQGNPPTPSQASEMTGRNYSGSSPPERPAYHDDNIDPSLQGTSSIPPANKMESSTSNENGQEDAFAGTGLSPDVQQVLKAVLAIDTVGNMNAKSSPDSDALPSNGNEKKASSLFDANIADLNNVKLLKFEIGTENESKKFWALAGSIGLTGLSFPGQIAPECPKWVPSI